MPAYNEEESVGTVVAGIRKHAPRFDVVIVDDGSSDATADRAGAAGATVIRHPFNLGIGSAVQSGYKYALRHGYDIAVQVDGDGQHDPEQIAVLEEALHGEGTEAMVWGSRYRGTPGYRVSIARRAGGRLFAAVVSAIVGQRVTDPTSGFRLTDRRAIALFASDYPYDYPEVEAILLLHAHRLTVREVPVRMNVRAGGRSSITLSRSAYYMGRVLLAILVGLFRRRPIPEAVESMAPAPSDPPALAGESSEGK